MLLNSKYFGSGINLENTTDLIIFHAMNNDLNKIISKVYESDEKTILIAIYNNQNQRRYIGVKLD